MAFHDVRLREDVEVGAMGGPRFKTTVLELGSGFEKRNQDWERSRGEWDLSYGVASKAVYENVISFFYNRKGRTHTFRFKDWLDFEIGVDATDVFQVLETADGVRTQFQFARRYTDDGGFITDRPVTKLVSGTVRVGFAQTEQFAGFTVDILTGVITFDSAPAVSTVITGIAEFDNHVRLAIDGLDLRAFTADALSVPAIPIREVRVVLVVLS